MVCESGRRPGGRVWLPVLLILAAPAAPGLGREERLTVADLGYTSGFQDFWENHYRRGRSIVADDFDGDGRLDYFIGNPGDESFIFRNVGPGPDGVPRFSPAQILLRGDLAFVASGADYDNDDDLDLFIGCGGLDGSCLDFLFRNDSTKGKIQFTDVSLQAGISGPARSGPRGLDGNEAPAGALPAHSTGGGTWGDYDRDGDPDLFVSLRAFDGRIAPYPGILWRNNGDGTFSDATAETGLNETSDGPGQMVDFRVFQNSTWIDADNDGDLDLFLNNEFGPNSLRKNLLVEQGKARFLDATRDFSMRGEDLRFPYSSFASAVADFNNDGWQDLILFAYGYELASSPYGNGNGLFLNRDGEGFFNAAARAGINAPNGQAEMSMGCQVADLNADGIPDLVMGAGDPSKGEKSHLLLSTRIDGEGVPIFEDRSALFDFEPPHGIDPGAPPYPQIPPYPYRTHGMAAGDADGDGSLELAVVNGGAARSPAIVREPNRLFRFSGSDRGTTLRAFLKGDGVTDGRHAIGARAYVEIRTSGGTRRIFQTVLGGSGFSAQNERTLTFGLGHDDKVYRLAILWPSGCLQVMDELRESPSPLVVEEACWTCAAAPGPVRAWLEPDLFGCSSPPVCRVVGNVSDARGPVPWVRVVKYHGEPRRMIDGRSGPDGAFSLENPYEPGVCEVAILEPFGYLPVSNPVWIRENSFGVETLGLVLIRRPEARWPRGAGYWLHQAKTLASDRSHAQEGIAGIEAWLEAIRGRYPGLDGFESVEALNRTLEGNVSRIVAGRLGRHLGAALLNLASGRLSSFTVLSSGERIGDLVERAYRWLGACDADPSEGAALAAEMEALNEGELFL